MIIITIIITIIIIAQQIVELDKPEVRQSFRILFAPQYLLCPTEKLKIKV